MIGLNLREIVFVWKKVICILKKTLFSLVIITNYDAKKSNLFIDINM